MTAARPRLTLIPPASTNRKASRPKMTKPPEEEAKKANLKAILAESIAETTPVQPGPAHRKMAETCLVDHVHMVRNGLEAVRSLVIPSDGRGEIDDLANLGRNDLVDLLELITDRLGLALEIAEK